MDKVERNRAAVKKHYEANKAQYLERNRKVREEKTQYTIKIREETPCMDCGVQYPHYVMQFDHRGDEPKSGNIGQLCAHSWKKLLAEIAKCDIVCANCHSIRTHQRRNMVR